MTTSGDPKETAARLAALRARLDALREEADRGRDRARLVPLVDACAAELSRLEDELASGTGSRLGALATRIASHFFVERSLPRFCERVLDELVEEVGASSGAVVLFKSDAAEAKVIAARDARRRSLDEGKLRVSRTILARIAEGEDSVLVEDALSDAQLGGEDSVQRLNLRSVLAIPLRFQDYLAGAIHLENERKARAFAEEDRDLLLGVGRLIAIYLNASFRLSEEIAARRRIYDEVKGKTHFDGIVGASPRLLDVLETVAQVGPSDVSVVIEGENGTGKELIARALHATSRRASGPLVVVNCAAIPENLLESELFGFERGAFTGALERKRGRLEDAHGGTLFLDEIGELSPVLQPKLLRFLQSGEIHRVGGSEPIHVDARVIAATNRDIRAMVENGEFRQDLYFRLYVVPIRVPPLRERVEDIPLLVDHFVRVYSLQAGRPAPEIDPEVYEVLQRHTWPGNVRELEALVQRLLVFARGGRIGVDDLPEHLTGGARATLETQKNPFARFLTTLPRDYEELKRRRLEMHRLASLYAQRLETRFIDSILERAGGNISRAAQEAGMHRTVIHRHLRTRRPPRDA